MLQICGMRILALVLGLLAGVMALGILGGMQLIGAQSEVNYYLQLIVAGLMLAGLYRLAPRTSGRSLSVAVLAGAFVIALMPVERAVSGGADQLMTIVLRYAVHGVLMAIFAFGLRHGLRRARADLKRT